jgi:hypothetical protein
MPPVYFAGTRRPSSVTTAASTMTQDQHPTIRPSTRGHNDLPANGTGSTLRATSELCNSLLLIQGPRRAAKNCRYITNPIFPSKALDYREITKPIYVAIHPLSALQEPVAANSQSSTPRERATPMSARRARATRQLAGLYFGGRPF